MSERWPHIAGRLDGGAHVLPVRVYFEDTDFSGVVYHASYLRFMERGRSDFMRLAGAEHADMFAGERGASFAVRRMTVDFLRPAVIDDVVEVTTRVEEVRGASVSLVQAVCRDGETLVTAEVRVALVSRSGRAMRIPADLRAVLGRRRGGGDASPSSAG